MKKKLLLVAAVVICLALATGGTLAYFTAGDSAHNVITSGGVSIELVEKSKNVDGAEADFPEEGITGVMPGTDVSKIVTVKNTGANEAWIRVRVEAGIKAADNVEDLSVEVMTYKIGEDWHKEPDGFIYYAKPVMPGESTGILFDTVSFDSDMDNEYQGCTANIDISAQAVQTAHNGNTVMEAAGWPEEKEGSGT